MDGGVQSIRRAISILRFVAQSGAGGCRMSDISRALDLHKASASRILTTLVASEAIERDPDRRFRIRAGFQSALGMPPSSARLRLAARPALARLVDALGDAAFLSVRSGFEAVCLDRQVGAYPIQALSLDVGSRRPLGIGAGSLALLAWLDGGEIAEAVASNTIRLRAYTAFTSDIIAALAEEARGQGYTAVQDLVIRGMTGIGVPVRDHSGAVVAAISIAAVTERLVAERRSMAVELLRDCCAQLESSLVV